MIMDYLFGRQVRIYSAASSICSVTPAPLCLLVCLFTKYTWVILDPLQLASAQHHRIHTPYPKATMNTTIPTLPRLAIILPRTSLPAAPVTANDVSAAGTTVPLPPCAAPLVPKEAEEEEEATTTVRACVGVAVTAPPAVGVSAALVPHGQGAAAPPTPHPHELRPSHDDPGHPVTVVVVVAPPPPGSTSVSVCVVAGPQLPRARLLLLLLLQAAAEADDAQALYDAGGGHALERQAARDVGSGAAHHHAWGPAVAAAAVWELWQEILGVR